MQDVISGLQDDRLNRWRPVSHMIAICMARQVCLGGLGVRRGTSSAQALRHVCACAWTCRWSFTCPSQGAQCIGATIERQSTSAGVCTDLTCFSCLCVAWHRHTRTSSCRCGRSWQLWRVLCRTCTSWPQPSALLPTGLAGMTLRGTAHRCCSSWDLTTRRETGVCRVHNAVIPELYDLHIKPKRLNSDSYCAILGWALLRSRHSLCLA